MFRETIWGVDVGSTAVRVVGLARTPGGLEIHLAEKLDTYRDPKASPVEEMSAALRKALSIFRVNHRVGLRDRVGVAIPGLGFETQLIDLPPITTKKIDEIVAYEIKSRYGEEANLATGFSL